MYYDLKRFDKQCGIKTFFESAQNDDNIKIVSVSNKWVKYFQKSWNVDCSSEFLQISEFFCIPRVSSSVQENIFLGTHGGTDEISRFMIQAMKVFLFIQ
jgi:hypothetical protein